MDTELYEKLPDSNALKSDVYCICTKEDFLKGVINLDQAQMVGDEAFPHLFNHIEMYELFGEIFECYNYCDPDQLEILDSHASRLLDTVSDKELLLKAYHRIDGIAHPWVKETLLEMGFEV